MLSTESLFALITSSLMTVSSLTTYAIHEGIIGFGNGDSVKQVVLSMSDSNINKSTASYDLFAASEQCELKIKDTVKAKISHMSFDNRSSGYNEKKNTNQVFYRIAVNSTTNGYGEREAYTATFSCHVSAYSNKIVHHNMHNFSYL